jgi:hypothetical protein
VPPAFSQFDEPHAWLIRGLVEYGWPDTSRSPGFVPGNAPGGMDLSRVATSEGRDGITLDMAAASNGRTCHDDGVYRFQVVVAQGAQGLGFTVRCPEANFLEEFPYDPGNPLWAAGYIHQALTGYVPQFVDWRLQGGEVTWAERAGMPKIDGQSASFMLSRFIGDQVTANRPLHHGPNEGWWLNAGPPAPAATSADSKPAWPGAVVTTGRGGGDPVFLSAAARDAAVSGQPVAAVGNLQAYARVKRPGTALMVVAGLGMLQAFLWFINGISVLAFYLEDSAPALIFSLGSAVLLLMGSGVAMLGAWQYRSLKGGPLPLVAIAFAAVVPICCLGGVPVAVWATLTWRDPMVKRARG